MLRDMQLLPVYDSAEHDLVRELQVPLLQNAMDYLRGVGFFTSGWLRIASRGVVSLAERGGRARIILSPTMEKGDWEALQLAEEARCDAELRILLERRVGDLRASLDADVLNALAWLIADGVIEMRFAVPRAAESMGNYHDKVAVFRDGSGDAVAIHGSLNDSVQGSMNGEAFSVFVSWTDGQRPYLQKHMERLEALWDGQNAQFRTCPLPDAIKEQIVHLRTTVCRPYSLPDAPDVSGALTIGPHRPVILHSYQEAAVVSWRDAGGNGVFEMATGTGKTVAALAAAVDKHRELGRLAVVVLVPYLHLLEQWERNCRAFGFSPILCSSSHGRWQIEVKARIQDLTLGATSSLCVVAVHATW